MPEDPTDDPSVEKEKKTEKEPRAAPASSARWVKRAFASALCAVLLFWLIGLGLYLFADGPGRERLRDFSLLFAAGVACACGILWLGHQANTWRLHKGVVVGIWTTLIVAILGTVANTIAETAPPYRLFEVPLDPVPSSLSVAAESTLEDALYLSERRKILVFFNEDSDEGVLILTYSRKEGLHTLKFLVSRGGEVYPIEGGRSQ